MIRALKALLPLLAIWLAFPVFADNIDKTVLITGANRGIGIEFARQYADAGWNVIATCRNPDTATELNDLNQQFKNLQVRQLDLTDHARIDELATELSGEPVDILLNNAALLGDMQSQLFGNIDYDQFAQILAVNTIGTMKMSEAFAGNVKLSTTRKIVTLGSAAGSIGAIKGHPDLYAYRASKAALHLLMKNLSIELADDGIIVGLINPGLVDTRGFADMIDGTKETPQEFAQIVALLKSGVLKLSTPEDAVADMRVLVDELGPEQSGKFLNADGTPLPW